MRYLQRYLGWAAIPNLTLWIICVQVCAYVCLHVPMRGLNQAEMIERIILAPDRVLAGEWWRVLTFICFPPITNPVFAFFAWWFFHLMGTYLESHWGTFRFNLYLWIWWVATVVVSLATMIPPPANYFLHQSVFLAFAFLMPEFVIHLFFLIPVQVKWVAAFTWFWLLFNFLVSDWATRAGLLAAVGNFVCFFARDIRRSASSNQRRIRWVSRLHRHQPEYRHQCVVCGATEHSHPDADFRYCSQCHGQACYCDAHLQDHEHRVAPEAESQS